MKKLLLLLIVMTSLAVNAQTTAIPDVNFETYLLNEGIDNAIDGQVLTANIDTITRVDLTDAWLIGWNITNLTGIQDFTALTYLECSSHDIDTIDLSQNINLTYLSLHSSSNILANIDVTQNTLLDTLKISSYTITSLDLSQNTALIYLNCGLNHLDSLDISQNTLLEVLYCYNNQLTQLDVSQNTQLYVLVFSYNNINSIDLSQNVNLRALGCESNQLTNLDLSHNTLLDIVKCNNNSIANLDLSQHPDFIELECENNNLTHLDIRNGNNNNIASFKAGNNPKLHCIYVDDSNAPYLNSAAWQKDSTSYYANDSIECLTVGLAASPPEQDMQIYPNPSQGIFNITTAANTHLAVYTTTGQLILEQTTTNSTATLNLTAYPQGIYYLKMHNNKQLFIQKVVVNN